jgi:segregation and condensation protein B
MSAITGKETSRDVIARLRQKGLIAAGPRSPDVGAPPTYVTTDAFLAHFGLDSIQDLPDIEDMRDAGLLDPEAAKGPAKGEDLSTLDDVD